MRKCTIIDVGLSNSDWGKKKEFLRKEKKIKTEYFKKKIVFNK